MAGNISPDNVAITLTYSQYVAAIGPGIPPDDSIKNCSVSLNMHYPQGYQYSFFAADYRGFAALDEGVTGNLSAIYWFEVSKKIVRQ
jgi:hypothetical protein